MEEEKGKRSIKLVCPCVSKAVQIIAGEEQKLDLGSIARAFGLDPNTLKLNGYYISRGIDLVASSVTWKSLIGYFSALELSTGATGSDPLVVDGKLSKIASKTINFGSNGKGAVNTEEEGYCRDNKRLQCTPNNERSESGVVKRKWWSDDESGLKKRTRLCNEAVSSVGFWWSKKLKRMRVDEMVESPAWKKNKNSSRDE